MGWILRSKGIGRIDVRTNVRRDCKNCYEVKCWDRRVSDKQCMTSILSKCTTIFSFAIMESLFGKVCFRKGADVSTIWFFWENGNMSGLATPCWYVPSRKLKKWRRSHLPYCKIYTSLKAKRARDRACSYINRG